MSTIYFKWDSVYDTTINYMLTLLFKWVSVYDTSINYLLAFQAKLKI